MTRYLLLVLAVLFLGGCYKEIGMIESQWDASRTAAGDLWQGEKRRGGEAPRGEATADSIQVPDSLAAY